MPETAQPIKTHAQILFWRAAASFASLALHARRLVTHLMPCAPAALAGALAYLLGHAVGLLLQSWLT
jgi:hypothetical protein